MSVKWGDLCGNKVFLRSFLGGKAPESLDRVHLFELFFLKQSTPIQSLKTDHYVLVISPPQMLEKFGGIGGAALEVRRRRLDSSFLTRQFSIRACASAEKILICARDSDARLTSKRAAELFIHTSLSIFRDFYFSPPSIQSHPFLNLFLSLPNFPLSQSRVVLPFARGEAGIISYTWRGARCGTAVMQASAQGFCAQKIQLKNNYQKISGSPVRLYCLNRCFLFICCNNRMLF